MWNHRGPDSESINRRDELMLQQDYKQAATTPSHSPTEFESYGQPIECGSWREERPQGGSESMNRRDELMLQQDYKQAATTPSRSHRELESYEQPIERENWREERPENRSIFPSGGNRHADSSAVAPRPEHFMSWSAEEKNNPWICAACTFVNENALHLTCVVCGTQRSRESPSQSFANALPPSNTRVARSQETVVITNAQDIEEDWYKTLQQERTDELIQLQREMFAEYEGE